MTVEIRNVSDLDGVWADLAEMLQALYEHLAPMTTEVFVEDWRERWHRMFVPALASGHGLLLIAYEDGRAVGFLNGQFRDGADVFEARLAYISNVYVRPEARGMRITSQLIDTAEAWFRDKGIAIVELSVADANEHGVLVWQHLGYEPFAQRRRKALP